MAAATKVKTPPKDNILLTDNDLKMKKGLTPKEVDRRLAFLVRTHRRLESALCFYLQEVEARRLHLKFSYASTVDYARERLGLEDKKTRALLNMAVRLDGLPKMKEAFRKGDIPWTKAREAVKAATQETDAEWVKKCKELSNRQIEKEVKKTVPHARKKTLVFVLEGDLLEQWEQAREACERLAGQTLSDTRVLDLMCAEMLCTYATTPPFDPDDEEDGGFARSVAERDGWRCTRPGCSCRSGLTGNHIIPRSQGGPDQDWNIHLVCAACHLAITEGRLKVTGRAPDGLTWDGPFGVIEKPLPLDREPPGAAKSTKNDQKKNATQNADKVADAEVDADKYSTAAKHNENLFVHEPRTEYEPFVPSHVGHDSCEVAEAMKKMKNTIPNGLMLDPSLGSHVTRPYEGWCSVPPD